MNPDPETLRRLLDLLFDAGGDGAADLSERDLERPGPGDAEASLLDAAFGEPPPGGDSRAA
ncbi:MAG TPA: hypothetical protein VNO22_05600 [Planctomycetota bacterium]|jgi:hypothetical protein|nr:hypothetical protein [Planctomycetota bacterium]